MPIEHVSIADPEIHEPKGVAAASADTAYVADGLGSGTWQKLAPASLNLSSLYSTLETAIAGGSITIERAAYFTGVIPDISTASSIYIPIPDDCTVVGAVTILGGSITTADAVISFYAGASSLGSTMTVTQSGSAAGDLDSFTASTNQSIVGPSYIRVATNGASDTAVPLYVTIKVLVNA